MELEIQQSERSGYTVLELSGRLNALSSAALKDAIQKSVDKGRANVILQLSGVSFIDSSGLSAMVSGLKHTHEAGGSLKLVAMQETPKRVFELTHLDRVFQFFDSLDAAVS